MTKLPPIVDVPTPAADQPSWVKVGIIAAVGFVLGVAWPKLVGVRLGPSAPADASHPTEAASAEPQAAPAAAPSASTTTAPANVASAAVPSAAPAGSVQIAPIAHGTAAVNVKPGILVSCKTEDGDTLKGKACGALPFDAIALPRLKKLAECPASQTADGKLSVMFHLDFSKSGRLNVSLGKSSTVEKPDDFSSCLSSAFDSVSIGAISHDNPRYTLAYAVRFGKEAGGDGATPSSPTSAQPVGAAAAPPANTAASMAAPSDSAVADSKETGEVVWDVAIVRDKARTGDVVARLPRGTKVRVATFKDGWYQIGFGDSMSNEGWVYRRAIGK